MSEEKRSLNPLRAIGTVLSAFSGIRRSKDSQEDMAKLHPLQIIIAAVLCVALLILGLITLVHSVAR